MMTHSLCKTDWEPDPSLYNTRPEVGSTPQIGGMCHLKALVFEPFWSKNDRFYPFWSEVEYDF